jgi:hypothetical protein
LAAARVFSKAAFAGRLRRMSDPSRSPSATSDPGAID